jgi:hypothetical protein
MLRCDSITPLGQPVVPPVWEMRASASPSPERSGSGLLSAISFSKDTRSAGASSPMKMVFAGSKPGSLRAMSAKVASTISSEGLLSCSA